MELLNNSKGEGGICNAYVPCLLSDNRGAGFQVLLTLPHVSTHQTVVTANTVAVDWEGTFSLGFRFEPLSLPILLHNEVRSQIPKCLHQGLELNLLGPQKLKLIQWTF